MSRGFYTMIEMLNNNIKVLKNNGYIIEDPEDEDFYIVSIYYDSDKDSIYCKFDHK